MNCLDILLLEDHREAAKIEKWLIRRAYTVKRAENVLDALAYLESGLQFKIAILDLDMDSNFLPSHLQKYALKHPTGWVFYKKILCENYPVLGNNTIILSAIVDDFIKTTSPMEYENIIKLINKENPDNEEQLEELLDKLKDEGVL